MDLKKFFQLMVVGAVAFTLFNDKIPEKSRIPLLLVSGIGIAAYSSKK